MTTWKVVYLYLNLSLFSLLIKINKRLLSIAFDHAPLGLFAWVKATASTHANAHMYTEMMMHGQEEVVGAIKALSSLLPTSQHP